MRKLILLLFILTACHERPIKKPFIIYTKWVESPSGLCTYFYKDSDGNSVEFVEHSDKYNIGDTLK